MSTTPGRNRLRDTWEYLVGSRTQYPLEQRVFNAVCLLTLILHVAIIPFNFFTGLPQIAFVYCCTAVICLIVYYLSRFKSRFQLGTSVFAVTALTALSCNYFLNDGIAGPTTLAFFLSFQFIIAIKPQRTYWFWVMIHLLLVLALYQAESYHPEWVAHSYDSFSERVADNYFSYIVILILTFFCVTFLRRSYYYEKVQAERRAESIETQHLQIAAQHLQLERLNQEKNKLFSIISHDLKSPLASICSYLELLSEDMVPAEQRKEFEKELLMVTGNTSELLQNLLSWSKTQMEGTAVRLAQLNLYQTLHATLDVQETTAEKKGIHLSYSIDDSMIVVADYDMLQLVVRNLVSNAIKFTDTGGSIQVKAYREDDHCRLVVKDTGRGIPVDKQEDIFTLKTSSTYGTNNEKGVGLGLVMCKEFTELQGGRIWFASVEGQGTTFYVSLPLHVDKQLAMFG
ncbi:sensor histidine kinase [Polluticoccus soli]|uniref:sensor histidine kinase n=1 Tax=Polluticoccus soli TaxID=3034150 RepID=UPI0023E0B849|nr:HAMP domain-containing sensor histidine kinase [Flavipsychrobacter sp. JY13-12]